MKYKSALKKRCKYWQWIKRNKYKIISCKLTKKHNIKQKW